MTTKPKAKKFRIRRTSPLAAMAQTERSSAIEAEADETDDGFGDTRFPTAASDDVLGPSEVAAETEIDAIRREGLTGRQLRMARRMAQKTASPRPPISTRCASCGGPGSTRSSAPTCWSWWSPTPSPMTVCRRCRTAACRSPATMRTGCRRRSSRRSCPRPRSHAEESRGPRHPAHPARHRPPAPAQDGAADGAAGLLRAAADGARRLLLLQDRDPDLRHEVGIRHPEGRGQRRRRPAWRALRRHPVRHLAGFDRGAELSAVARRDAAAGQGHRLQDAFQRPRHRPDPAPARQCHATRPPTASTSAT